MENLTDKQIKARAYYAKNAKKINAQKRKAYKKTAKANKKSPIKPAVTPVTDAALEKAVEPSKIHIIRQKIEDRKLAKELGIDSALFACN